MEAVYVLLSAGFAGTASLLAYLGFRRGAASAFQRRVALLSISLGMRHLPVMLAVGAAFWYSIVLAGLASYLPDGGVRTVAMATALVSALVAAALFVVWAYRPPRRLVPRWYQAELDSATKVPVTKRSRMVNTVLLWLAAILLTGTYAAFRLDAPLLVRVVAGLTGATVLIGYVLRE